MTKPYVFILAALVLTSALATTAEGQASGGPETVVVHKGSVTLHALLWRPQGRGPFPAILFHHGSGRTREELERLGPYERRLTTRTSVRSPYLCIPISFPARLPRLQGRDSSIWVSKGANAIGWLQIERFAIGEAV